jgi:pullulanase
MRKIHRFEAHLDDYGTITAYLSKNFYNGRSDHFYLRTDDQKIEKCTILHYENSGSEYYKYTLKVRDDLPIGAHIELVEEHGLAVGLHYSYITKSPRFDEEFAYLKNDLGARVKGQRTQFKLWAPTAQRVLLELFTPKGPKRIELKRHAKGVFSASVAGSAHGQSYLYHVYVNGRWNTSTDPYAVGSLANHSKSVVIDFDQLPPLTAEVKGSTIAAPTDAILYELSVRDFTMHPESGVVQRGRFLGLSESGTKTSNNFSTGLDYLVELGVTHVQLMPIFDFATVDEHNVELFYNWGYDPVQYNVPEGSFSSQPDDPFSRIVELRSMIDALHQAGLRVVMDVVYNHVYDMNTSPFEKVVPYYYFRRSATGSLSNGSFCGNDFDSNHVMARQFILNSGRHYLQNYNIDGFRFDLMGVLDVETMNAFENLARRMKPDCLIYGEGWNMPTSLPEELKANQSNQHRMPRVGHFNDFFRDHVKGKTTADQINVKGYCLGDTSYLEAMKACMVGTSLNHGWVKLFDSPTQSINYVECHDNHTVWDKMRESNKEDSREVRIKRQKMMLGVTLLAQGVPFIHSGQEFCRTKNMVHNSYRTPDSINQIDWTQREIYADVVNYLKDMIRLRKMLPIFRLSDVKKVERLMSFREFDGMLIVEYRCLLKVPYEALWVYINPTNQIYYETFASDVKVIANEAGLIDGMTVQHATINPYTMVVFAKA